MTRRAIVFVIITVTILSGHLTFAQSAVMPHPGVVVKDADGKVIAEVVGFHTPSSMWPMVVIDVEGTPAFLFYRPYGLIDRIASEGDGTSVYFSDDNCMGDPYLNQVVGLEQAVGTYFGVGGPDATTGEYRLFRSTTIVQSLATYNSKWKGGVCMSDPSSQSLLPAEEVIPNPLEGFHGPTQANPERTLTIAGGTRLP